MRVIKWMRVLPRPLARTRIKKLVGEEVYRCIDGPELTTVVHGGMGPLVLNLLPFFKHVFVTMCPTCSGVEDSSTLMPLLERGFVVPVLLGPTASYPARFIQDIAAYPHIPGIVYFYLKVAQLEIHERGWAKPHLCLNCFANLHNELIQEINDRVADESVRDSLLRRVLPGLYLPSGIAQTVMDNLKELLRGAGTIDNDSLEILAEGISCFGDSVALSSVLTLEAPMEANRPVGIDMPQPPYLLADALGEASVRLGIAYSPDVSVADYVKVLEPHVGSCATLFAGAATEDQYERVIQRTRDISSEIRLAARSKRGRIANFGLTLGRANPAVVAGLLGGALGLAAAGLAGCGLGSAAAAAAAGLKKAGRLRLPDEAMYELDMLLKPVKLATITSYYGITREAASVWSIRSRLQALLGKPTMADPPVLIVDHLPPR